MQDFDLIPLAWHTEQRRPVDLVPYEYNPRKMTAKQNADLKASLEKFGLVEIPAINTDDTLVAGHQRCRHLIETGKGEEYIDVRVPNRPLTEEEFKEYLVRSNKNTGEWDKEILANVFQIEDLVTWGFDPSELIEPAGKTLQFMDDTQGDDEAPAQSGQAPLVVPGDLFQLGEHRLLCGDAANLDNWTKLLEGQPVRLVLTSTPASPDPETGAEDLYEYLYDFYVNCYASLSDGSPLYIFHDDLVGVPPRKALLDAGLKFSEVLIWIKNEPAGDRLRFHSQHEPILYGWKEGAAHPWYSDRKQTTVLEYPVPPGAALQGQKPVALLEYLLKNSSQPGDVVVDGFGTSGSVLLACQKQGRRARVLDFSPSSVELIIRRYVQFCTENGVAPVVRHLNGTLTMEQIVANV